MSMKRMPASMLCRSRRSKAALPCAGVRRRVVVAVEAGALGQAGDLDAGLAQAQRCPAGQSHGAARRPRNQPGAVAISPAPATEALKKSRRVKESMVRPPSFDVY